ncbi:hypothetical protein C8R43DRAFT_942639 [Mycena crocata]|nr:hypothetical protein C8R43DRAFT_942639 [Mycena crocata]
MYGRSTLTFKLCSKPLGSWIIVIAHRKSVLPSLARIGARFVQHWLCYSRKLRAIQLGGMTVVPAVAELERGDYGWIMSAPVISASVILLRVPCLVLVTGWLKAVEGGPDEYAQDPERGHGMLASIPEENQRKVNVRFNYGARYELRYNIRLVWFGMSGDEVAAKDHLLESQAKNLEDSNSTPPPPSLTGRNTPWEFKSIEPGDSDPHQSEVPTLYSSLSQRHFSRESQAFRILISSFSEPRSCERLVRFARFQASYRHRNSSHPPRAEFSLFRSSHIDPPGLGLSGAAFHSHLKTLISTYLPKYGVDSFNSALVSSYERRTSPPSQIGAASMYPGGSRLAEGQGIDGVNSLAQSGDCELLTSLAFTRNVRVFAEIDITLRGIQDVRADSAYPGSPTRARVQMDSAAPTDSAYPRRRLVDVTRTRRGEAVARRPDLRRLAASKRCSREAGWVGGAERMEGGRERLGAYGGESGGRGVRAGSGQNEARESRQGVAWACRPETRRKRGRWVSGRADRVGGVACGRLFEKTGAQTAGCR